MPKNATSVSYEACGANEQDAIAVGNLSPAAIEFAYQVINRAYKCRDAKRHCDRIFADRPKILDQLNEDDYDAMAERFETRHDENIPDIVQWKTIILDYVENDLG